MANTDVVMVDIDSGLADMSSYAWMPELRPESRKAWKEFYSHVEEAAVVEAGRRVVSEVAAAGFTIVYSTSRPFSAVEATRRWLVAQDFPGPAAVYSRLNWSVTTSALQDKIHHCDIVRSRIRCGCVVAFIDDDAEIVTHLRARGYPGVHLGHLQRHGVGELTASFVAGNSPGLVRANPKATDRMV
jgi:hypothetical protein